MQLSRIRSIFLDFFSDNNHKVVKSSSLIPSNDPTLMFTNSGMVQFKNYFTGVDIPSFQRATTAQKCVRAGGKHNDLENVGYTARHHTFFEMLGNFSFGDYFKEEAIVFAWELLTKFFQISKEKLYVTIYHNDDEAYKIWNKVTGFNDSKIIRIATNDNFWSMGDTGPCGPCTEIFYDHGDKYEGGLPGTPEADGDRYIEIWNLVFMQYEKLQSGEQISLPKASVDTGMGLERIAAVLQGVNNNFEIDLFKRIIENIIEISGDKKNIVSQRVIADHLRSSAFLIADGVLPSNEGRGYVLRRIMRRAMRHIYKMSEAQNKNFMLYQLVTTLTDEMGESYPELRINESFIKSVMRSEEERFRDTLGNGMQILNAAVQKLSSGQILSGEVAFKLYDTYGFPLDLTRDILRENSIGIDEAGFEKCMLEQKNRSKVSWKGSGDVVEDRIWSEIYEKNGATEFVGYHLYELDAKVVSIIHNSEIVTEIPKDVEAILVLNQTPFYGESGGQMGDIGSIGSSSVLDTKIYHGKVFGHKIISRDNIRVGDVVHAKIDIVNRKKVAANHSATHILQHVLRRELGDHIAQKGSYVGAEKLRFDFSCDKQLNQAELDKVEQEVNKIVIANYEVGVNFMEYNKAIDKGAIAFFSEKYGDEVRVVSMGDSVELCGGTHVKRTGDIGLFKIVTETSVAASVRRIEAYTGIAALNYCNLNINTVKSLGQILKCSDVEILTKINSLSDAKKNLEKQISEMRIKNVVDGKHFEEDLSNGELKLILIDARNYDIEPSSLKNVLELALQEKYVKFKNSVIIVLGRNSDNQMLSMLIKVRLDNDKKGIISANKIVSHLTSILGGKGGGNDEMAQLGGMPDKIATEDILKEVHKIFGKY